GDDGLIPTTDQFGTALGDIVRCTACGHMQLRPLPAEQELDAAYGDAESEDYVEEAAGQRETARRTLDRIERYVAPGPLLDVGAWVGYLVAEAGDRGWTATGLEPSAFASAFARERLGVDVRTGGLFDTELPVGRFAAVTMGDVIEHLVRPDAALDRIAGLLAPGGVLWLALPDAGSRIARTLGRRWWSVIPTHVQYFTRGSIRALLARRGYDVLDIATAPKAFTVRYYLDRIGGYSRPAASALVGAARAAGVADRMWAPDFRDRMMVVARGPRAGR
ncbi:MAG TPA: class I SAM-dependent methyltransferase, partial [Solirubrobacteraceae bacterium]|nr:class I SAM-dependent methyltransferase [Solirubrobacteraceae bacterium]